MVNLSPGAAVSDWLYDNAASWSYNAAASTGSDMAGVALTIADASTTAITLAGQTVLKVPRWAILKSYDAVRPVDAAPCNSDDSCATGLKSAFEAGDSAIKWISTTEHEATEGIRSAWKAFDQNLTRKIIGEPTSSVPADAAKAASIPPEVTVGELVSAAVIIGSTSYLSVRVGKVALGHWATFITGQRVVSDQQDDLERGVGIDYTATTKYDRLQTLKHAVVTTVISAGLFCFSVFAAQGMVNRLEKKA